MNNSHSTDSELADQWSSKKEIPCFQNAAEHWIKEDLWGPLFFFRGGEGREDIFAYEIFAYGFFAYKIFAYVAFFHI